MWQGKAGGQLRITLKRSAGPLSNQKGCQPQGQVFPPLAALLRVYVRVCVRACVSDPLTRTVGGPGSTDTTMVGHLWRYSGAQGSDNEQSGTELFPYFI